MNAISSFWILKPGEEARPGWPQFALILLWTGTAVLMGMLGSFSIPVVDHISLFWPAMIFQTVGGLWFGGPGIIAAVIFPLLTNALSGMSWELNLAWIPGNLIVGGLARFYFQYRGWDPSLPTSREVWGFLLVGAVLSNSLGALSTLIYHHPANFDFSWEFVCSFIVAPVIGNALPCAFLGLPLLKIFSPVVVQSRFFFPSLFMVRRFPSIHRMRPKDFPIALKLFLGFFTGGFLPMAVLAAFSVSEEERYLNILLSLSLFLCILMSGYITNYFHQSLKRITASLHEVGEGEFECELSFPNMDELGMVANGIQEMSRNLDRLYKEQKELFMGTILALADAIEARDPYTRGHSDRVSHYAYRTGKMMNLSDEELRQIYIAGILHDIGKIGIRRDVLHHNGPLSPEQYGHLKTHPTQGARILEIVSALDLVRALVEAHHERFDGMGYSRGLKERAIPLGARILAVADAYDAMTSDRPYRRALSHEEAILEIRKGSGTQFDPQIVTAFLRILP